ncbi:MAG: aromatic ring-hydroxylating dioxygenase subunit alpha [Actinobacteria bacterium]|nr:aromatic ring-hydroxylating dioxygenase subunit alpha [Actinomycetota bacterium]NDF67453.1 aromatic ring-hydroxylating dioxygenase subunit alpha [Actinomycetota bacterium]
MDGRLRRCANRFGMEFMTKKEVSGLSESFNRDEYNSPEIFALEMQKIYGTNWCFAGLSEELTKIGDRLVVDIGNESVLVLRNRENQLRAFYNVCQHRGSQLCDASGSGFGAAITCPYHAWSYSVEGALVATPLHEKDSIDRSTLGLKQVKVDEWQGAIFISLDPNAEPLTKWLDDHYSRPRELEKFDLANLKNARTTIDEVEANWKVLAENYSECLHCGVVHPELVDLVPVYKTGNTIQEDRADWGVSLSPGATSLSFKKDENLPLLPSMDDLDDYSVFGAYVYPNMLIDISPTVAVLTRYVPRSATHTTIFTYYLFPKEVVGNSEFNLEPTISFSDLVNQQDISVCVRVQRGVASRSFTNAFHTKMERYCKHLIRRYRAEIK